MERLTIHARGIDFGALAWGEPGDPLALLVHGYPDTAWTWRHLGPYLAERGWDRRFSTAVSVMLTGNVVIYACGLVWLHHSLGVNTLNVGHSLRGVALCDGDS